MVVKALVNIVHVLLIVVVPSALVVTQSETLRQWRGTSQGAVLTIDVLGRGASHDKQIDDPTLREPMSLFMRLAATSSRDQIHQRRDHGSTCRIRDVDPHLGCVVPKDSSSPVLAGQFKKGQNTNFELLSNKQLLLGHHERHSSVKCHRAGQFIFEDVRVVKSVRIHSSSLGKVITSMNHSFSISLSSSH